MTRPSGRRNDQMRAITFERQYTCHAEGSVLASFGNTKVLCTASVASGVPRFLKGSNSGWVTAEYGMLPRSTNERMNREAARGKQSGRTQEIQRLIGRSLRSAMDLESMGEYTITIDCDVIQADGGTRTTAISGAYVAVSDAIAKMIEKKQLTESPFREKLAAISVGIYQGNAVLDLDYAEDSNAETDMNVVMTESGKFIEIQGTAEADPFDQSELTEMLALAGNGIKQICQIQKMALAQDS